MRRKPGPGTLIPLEQEVLRVAETLAQPFHGYALAKAMREDKEDARRLIAFSTLYRTLRRLEGFGLLSGHWEAVQPDATDHVPRKRLYTLIRCADLASAG